MKIGVVRMTHAYTSSRNGFRNGSCDVKHHCFCASNHEDLENGRQRCLLFHVVAVHRRRNPLALLRLGDQSNSLKLGQRSFHIVRGHLLDPQGDQGNERQRGLSDRSFSDIRHRRCEREMSAIRLPLSWRNSGLRQTESNKNLMRYRRRS
jgi:hypothetical protein